ncbi:hypothetical protein GEMRC1_001401 [Eukaryota sp. GEM-RC1]
MAKLLLLSGDVEGCQSLLIGQGLIDEVIELFSSLGFHSKVLEIAQECSHPSLATIKDEIFKIYVESGQEVLAAEIKENDGDSVEAINLYIKAMQPKKAADLIDHVTSSLIESKDYQTAGLLFEKGEQFDNALSCFENGKCFNDAIRVASHHNPSAVNQLQLNWGINLLERHQPSAATFHFLECGAHLMASYAELRAGSVAKAVEYMSKNESTVDHPDQYLFITKQYLFNSIAEKFENSSDFQRAEMYYSKAGFPEKAVEMYTRNALWADAHRCALKHMSPEEVKALYVEHANNLEISKNFKEAENLYLTVNEADLAIDMYKKISDFASMIRLVKIYRKEFLPETHLSIAKQLEASGSFKEAEKHYLSAKEWKSAVNMYQVNHLWSEALGLAKMYGGSNACRYVAYCWAVERGGQAGVDLLISLGFVDQAIEFSVELELEEVAISTAKKLMPSMLNYVYTSLAGNFAKNSNFERAEELLISGNCIREAVDMYIDKKDWVNAMRVAEHHQSKLIDYVRECQSKSRPIDQPPSLFRPSPEPISLPSEADITSLIGNNEDQYETYSNFPELSQLLDSGDFKRAWTLAEQSPSALRFFGHEYGKYLFKNDKINECLEVLAQCGIEISTESVDLIENLSVLILSANQNSPFNQLPISSMLRQILLSMWNLSKTSHDYLSFSPNIESLLWMSHLYCRGQETREMGLLNLSAKLFTSLLRFNDVLPSDKLFFEAGEACKLANETNAAWVFLDKYVDIVEAMDDGSEFVENSNLISTDIPLTNVKVPTKHYASTKDRESQRQYVLTMSMADEVCSEPNNRACPNCGELIYDCRMSCNFCQEVFTPCAASGAPLSATSEIWSCNECSMVAGVKDLNSWTSRTRQCPWCNCPQVGKY